MKLLKLLIVFFLLIQIAFGQSASGNNNYKGWRELTWESTETDVKQKYGNQITILPTPEKYGVNEELYCPFKIHNYVLGYDNFTVSFLFDVKTNKLFQVNVQKDDPLDIRRSVQDLEVSLTEKYGKPIVKEETPKYISKWSFNDLTITLTYSDLKVGDVQIMKTIFLTYRKPEKTKLDNF